MTPGSADAERLEEFPPHEAQHVHRLAARMVADDARQDRRVAIGVVPRRPGRCYSAQP